MQTSSSVSTVVKVVYEYACGLSAAGRVFTMRQVAQHPELSWRKQPIKRASEILSPYRQSFDIIPWNRRFLWRLSSAEKKRRGLNYRDVSASQHAEHWLALGDVWAHLVLNGLRPTRWFTEGKDIGRFDVFAEIQNSAYLIEVQNTPISKREWERKWRLRYEWLKLERWRESEWSQDFANHLPRIVLVTTKPMDVLAPKGVIYAKSIDQLHHALRPPRL